MASASSHAALFDRLKTASAAEWQSYVSHPFVRGLADGSLPAAAFRAYLIQDYLFLIQFARAYALAAYKSDRLEDMRQAAGGLDAIVNMEMKLHVAYCAEWGIDEASMADAPEHPYTVAYTRFVLDTGQAGDLLDLHVALAPCMLGYAEIGARLLNDPQIRREGNPYWPWIELYGGEEFQAAAQAESAIIDSLFARRGSTGREPDLARIFAAATRLEAAFWQVGLDSGVSEAG